MKKSIGTVAIGLGLLCTVLASNDAKRAPDLPYLMGTYLPGIILLAVGVALRRDKKPPVGNGTENPFIAVQARRSSNAEMGVIGGIVLMFLGSGVSQQSRDLFLLGFSVSLGGWVLMIWGAANYVVWKGYSAWFGLLGLLLLPGLIVLACLPNKTKPVGPILDSDAFGESPFRNETTKTRAVAGVVIVSFLIMVTLFSAVVAAGPVLRSMLQRTRTPDVWTTLVIDSPKFSVEMPANPQEQDLSQESPRGRVTAAMYQSTDNLATYTVAFVAQAPDVGTPQDATRVAKLLDASLDDWVARNQGRLLYRKSISVGEHLGREQVMECILGIENRSGKPVSGRSVVKAFLLGGGTVSINVVVNKSDYDKNPSGIERRMARFFDSFKPE